MDTWAQVMESAAQLYVFEWVSADFDALVDACTRDTGTPYILKYMPRRKVLEAGCGFGRFLVLLSERDYDVEGVEISQTTLDQVKGIRPDLKIAQGDVHVVPPLALKF